MPHTEHQMCREMVMGKGGVLHACETWDTPHLLLFHLMNCNLLRVDSSRFSSRTTLMWHSIVTLNSKGIFLVQCWQVLPNENKCEITMSYWIELNDKYEMTLLSHLYWNKMNWSSFRHTPSTFGDTVRYFKRKEQLITKLKASVVLNSAAKMQTHLEHYMLWQFHNCLTLFIGIKWKCVNLVKLWKLPQKEMYVKQRHIFSLTLFSFNLFFSRSAILYSGVHLGGKHAYFIIYV